MTELKLGTKHECSSCSTKYYDMEKPDALCPKCGAEPGPQPEKPPERVRTRAAPKKSPPPAKKKAAGSSKPVADGEEE